MSEGAPPPRGVFLEVVDWKNLQHYKDRKPPWIKLYNAWLSDAHFSSLYDHAKAHLCMIWMLSSMNDNLLPADPLWIAAMIRATEPVRLEELVRNQEGWLRYVDADRNVLDSETWLPVADNSPASSVASVDASTGDSTLASPREEESREEEREKSASVDEHADPRVSSTVQALNQFCKQLAPWDLRGKTPEQWVVGVLEDERYARLDVAQEIRNATDWWDSTTKTSNRKIKAPSRALGNWLRKAADWGDDDPEYDVGAMQAQLI